MAVDKMEEQFNSRLERIENKIDRLSDAMIDLARAEEKLLSVEKFNIEVNKKIDDLDKRLHTLESLNISNTKTIKIINTATYIIGAGVIGAVIKILFDIDLGN